MCDAISDDLVHGITEAAKRPGAYYTYDPAGRQLLVIPSLRYVVYSYYD